MAEGAGHGGEASGGASRPGGSAAAPDIAPRPANCYNMRTTREVGAEPRWMEHRHRAMEGCKNACGERRSPGRSSA